MIKERFIAVIDIGRTNAKLVLVDLLDLSEVDLYTRSNVVINKAPFPHFDHEALWDFIKVSLRQMRKHYRVDAISASAHGAAAMLLGENGDPILPMLDYEYEGPDILTLKYDLLRPDFELSGSPRLPLGHNLGAQLHWILNTQPKICKHLSYIVTYPQYWTGRLTGTWSTEVTSLGCHTDLWLPYAGKFSSLVKKLGLEGKFAPLRKANDVIGTILPELSQEIGFSPSTPVYCGIHDSNAAIYRHLLSQDKPFSVLSTGTWIIAMAIGGRGHSLNPLRDTLINVNAFGDSIPSARFMGGREFEILICGDQVTPTKKEIMKVLKQVVTLSPSVVAHSGPFQGKRSEWSIAESKLTKGERAAVISLYLAMMTLTCLELSGAEGSIWIEGPFIDNKLFLDLIAAKSGVNVLIPKGSVNGPSIGAALLASKVRPKLSEPDIHHSPEGEYLETLISYAMLWNLRVKAR